MNPDPQFEKRVFAEALEFTTPEQRAKFLTKACGDDIQLRQRIEALLQAHDQLGEFLQAPAPDVSPQTLLITAGMVSGTEKPGDKIGRYKLREQIGEGGCGVVYVAEQEEPVRRRVALKVIKSGMDTKQVVARFEAERQALALMDHPNIAKVLDAGATETGRPFFVMELVRGIKITDYCDQNNLPTKERLNLFIEVCTAIQHAHQKGIIHRDIKPSNILVTLHDGVPVPKVIDFGIAKATSNQRLTDKTIYTAFEQFLGTPAYMSPEQAEMSGLDIDTRSDIYSLGVLLYELLTGSTPFDARALLQAGLDQMRRIIREQEPPRPSACLSTLGDADLTAVAHARQSEPPRLLNLIRGDLDWIAMKCLEKDRTRRFETVNALAMDVKRHLDNEPVVARPPSAAYRFQKMVRRNTLAFALSTAVMVMIVGALIVSFSLMHKEKVALERALSAETSQRRMAQEAEANELIYRATGVLAEIENNSDGPDSLKLYLKLPEAEKQLRKVVAIRTKLFGYKDPGVMDALTKLSKILEYRAYPLGGEETEATRILRKAIDIEKTIKGNDHPDVANSLESLIPGFWDISNEEHTIEVVLREVVDIRRKHPGHNNTDLYSPLAKLAEWLYKQNKLSETESFCREATALSHSYIARIEEVFPLLLEAVRDQNRLADAENVCHEWKEYLNELNTNSFADEVLRVRALMLHSLAEIVRAEGRPEESRSIEHEALTAEKDLFIAADGGKIYQRWHIERLAAGFVKRHQVDAMERLFSNLFLLEPNARQRSSLLKVRADMRARLQQYQEAAEDLAEAAKYDFSLETVEQQAVLFAERNDLPSYNQCAGIIWASENFNPYRNTSILRSTLLLPRGLTNLAEATRLAERLQGSITNVGGYFFRVSDEGSSASPLNGTDLYDISLFEGLTLYRSGKFGKAKAFAERAIFYDPNPITHTLLAMAQWQLGDQETAQSNLAKAVELQNEFANQSWSEWVYWAETLPAEILLREARSMIEGRHDTKATTP